MPSPTSTARYRAPFVGMAIALSLSTCHRSAYDTQSGVAPSDSARLVHVAVTDFRRATSDSGPMLVAEFVRAGDSVIIVLQPDVPTGQMTFRGGGRLVLRRGAVVSRELWQ